MKGKLVIALLLCYAIPCVILQSGYGQSVHQSQLRTALEQGDWPRALTLTREEDPDLYRELLRRVSGCTLAAGADSFAYIRSDGKAVRKTYAWESEVLPCASPVHGVFYASGGYMDLITADGKFLTSDPM